jgi:hypothetical protein
MLEFLTTTKQLDSKFLTQPHPTQPNSTNVRPFTFY